MRAEIAPAGAGKWRGFAPWRGRRLIGTAMLVVASAALSPVTTRAQSAASPAASAASGPTLRAEIATPLQAAQNALRAGNHGEALARVAEAEKIAAPTPYERYVLLRLKAAALYGAGELERAAQAFDSALDLPDMPAADRLPVLEISAKLALQRKDYPRAVARLKVYFAAGGADAELRGLYPQVLALAGDSPGAAREAAALVAADEQAGRVPAEALLRLLASTSDSAGDPGGYLRALERLALTTGKAEYWSELIARTTRRDGFAAERLRLDVYRLRRAAGLPLQGREWVDMAQRAFQAGLPGEARAVLQEGAAQKMVGVGADAAADRKLVDLVGKAAAQDEASSNDSEAAARKAADGNALASLGMALSGAGKAERGAALIAAGEAKAGLRRPDDTALHLGIALWRAGQREAALQSWARVKGSDGNADLARLWSLLARRPAVAN